MTYSALTYTIVGILFYGSALLGTFLIWRTYKAETERAISFKLFGYILISAFKFNFNSISLPLGLILTYFLQIKAARNKQAKGIAIIFGAFLFAISLYPFQNHLEQRLYPRNDINTYLQVERTPGKEGFTLTISDKTRDLILRSYIEKEKMGRDIYRGLAKSRSLDQLPSGLDWKYRFDLFQDSEDDRFRELTFEITEDGRLILLKFENRPYYFEGTQEFQGLMAALNKEFQLQK